MTDPTDTEALALARDFRDLFTTARALARAAYLEDTASAYVAAGKASLDAGLPAQALRQATQALGIDPGHTVADMLRRTAVEAIQATRRAQAQQGSAFAAALYQMLFRVRVEEGLAEMLLTPVVNPALEAQLGADIVRETGSVCALDIINATLAAMGAGGVAVRMVGGTVFAITRCQLRASKAGAAECLAKVTAEGSPCESCGAPRWTFAQDDDLGSYCSSCAWPHPVAALNTTRKRKSIAELEAALAASRTETAEANKRTEAALAQVKGMEGKINKLTKTVQGEADARRRLMQGGSVAVEDLSLEDLHAAAQGAAAQAQAGADRVAELAVRIAKKAGES